MLPASLIKEIRALHALRFPEHAFEPGVTPVPPSGKVFDAEEMLRAAEAVFDGWWTEGRFTAEFEKRFAALLGRNFAATTNSGSSANLLAFTALTSKRLGERRIKPGDEVITVAAGFPTTVTPIIQNRCVPVFVDIDPATYNIDIGLLEKALSSKTRAVMIAHTLGNPFPAASVAAFCKEHGLWLVEDTCDALGSFYDGRPTGTFGDISTFSFYPAHHITMGEGGALVTDDALLNKVIRSFRDWGRDCWCAPGKDNTCGIRFDWQLGTLPKGYDHKYIYSEIGYNLKITDTQAALGLSQLEKLQGFNEARRQNHIYLRSSLEPLDGFFRLPDPTPNSDPSWFGFLISVRPHAPFSRDEIVRFLNERKIGTRNLFAGNIIRQPLLAGTDVPYRVVGTLTNTDDVMLNGFWVGCYPGLSKAALDYVVDSFREFCRLHADTAGAKPSDAHEEERTPDLSVVIPAYNEAHQLEGVIRRLWEALRSANIDFEIVLVNNGSTDGTREIAASLERALPEIRAVHVFPNEGFGNGVLQGLSTARGKILGWMHADGQASPEQLLQVYREAKAKSLDVCRAVRIQRDEPRWRLIQSEAYNRIFRGLFGMPHRDINGTPKLMSRDFYERAALCSKEWFIDPEVMLKAGSMGASIGEVEIHWSARHGGKSKVHFGTMFQFLRLMLKYRFRKDSSTL